jgi:hypothetical protein
MSSESFYIDLPCVDNFSDVANPSIYTELPDDWLVAVSDVKDSTRAIQQGGYKKVNLLGASSIIAILNLNKSFSLPFIFGGDGASICIPGSLLQQTRQSLVATKLMAKDVYGIELRVGIVPLSYIKEQGFNVMVARCRLSDTHSQAAFTGGGLQFSEECIKETVSGKLFCLHEGDAEPIADFSGLECRWMNVPSVHGEVLTLIVQAMGPSVKKKNETYSRLIEKVENIFGTDAAMSPVRAVDLSMSLSERQLSGESNIRSYGKGTLFRIWYWFTIRYRILLGSILMRMKWKTKQTNWGDYKNRLVANTDFKKFDDKLRQVISCSVGQRKLLQTYLENKFRAGELVYGLHTAPNALVTCLIYNYHADHIHLVDSDNGGYAVAAARLKEQLKEIGIR